MTHFTVGIIVPKTVSDIESYVVRQMNPYFEHQELEPYVCYSLERAAADIADTIRRMELIIGRNDPDYQLDKCQEILAQLRTMTPEQKYAEYVETHETFNERGEPLSAYNSDGKWDWYVIGGRWDGWINGRDTNVGSVEDNSASTEDGIANDKIPHAIITPDGQWHEHGRMGWWATLLTENENWDQDARDILARYPGHRFLIVDAHI